MEAPHRFCQKPRSLPRAAGRRFACTLLDTDGCHSDAAVLRKVLFELFTAAFYFLYFYESKKRRILTFSI